MERKKIILVEGPQGSGKTTAVNHLSELGYIPIRGIPDGDELSTNREVENWKRCCGIYEDCLSSTNGKTVAMDRSIWSLVAYNIRKKPEQRELIYRLGRNIFQRRLTGFTSPTLLFLEADPETCYGREDHKGRHSLLSPEQSCQEVEVYGWLAGQLERDGFVVRRLVNSGISQAHFKKLLVETVLE